MKSKKSDIFLYFEANEKVGLGHLYRLHAILRELSSDFKLYLIGTVDQYRANTKIVGTIITKENFEKKLSENIDQNKNSILITDHPKVPVELWDYEEKSFVKIAIDDVGGTQISPDIVFNCSLTENYHNYPDLPEHGKKYLGVSYLPVSRAFSSKKKNERNIITFSIGSSRESYKWALLILTGMDKFFGEWSKVNFLVSPTFDEFDKLNDLAKKKKVNLLTNLAQEEIASLYKESKIIVCTGGMSLYEALTSNNLVVTYPLLENMKEEVLFLAEKGLVESLGDKGNDINFLERTISDLLKDGNKITKMKNKTQEVFDGNGLSRIANIINEVIDEIEKSGDKFTYFHSGKK